MQRIEKSPLLKDVSNTGLMLIVLLDLKSIGTETQKLLK